MMKPIKKPKNEFKALGGNRLAWIQFDDHPEKGDKGLMIGHDDMDPVYLYSLPHLRKFHRWIGQYIAYLEAQKAQKGKAK